MARTFCIAIALLLCAAGAVVGEDSCSSSGSTVAVAPTDSVVEVRLVFVSFPDYAQQNLPTWADSLKNEFNAFIQSMSHGKQRFNISILTDPANSGKAWVANSNYINYSGQYGKLNREVMFRIKDAYSNPFSGVEELIIYHYRCAFPSAGCPGWGGVATLNITNAAADSVGFSGTGSTCRLLESGSINSAANKKYVFFNTGHEYGHNITINHSPNTFSPPCSSEDPNPYYVNMGLYDCMRANGSYANTQGFLPYHPLSLLLDTDFQGWLRDSVITADVNDLRIKDIRNTAGRPMRINMGSDQYFLLVNHQGTAFDAKYPGTGLLVWHVIDDLAWDLESAYGKFDNIGPNQTPNPVSGMDLLEYDCTRLGGPEDFFDGTPDDFTCSTNPHTYLYNPGVYTDPQNTPTWLALENIQQDGSDILVDVSLTPQRVTAPNGGEIKPVGQAVSVTWNVRSNACVSTVDILLSTNGGSSFSSLATGEANDGTYSWTPSTLSTQNRVRVVSKNATPTTIGTDDSDANFTVWGPSGVTHTNLVVPEDSIKVDITWDTNVATSSSDDVVVFYTTQTGSTTIPAASVTYTTTNGGLSHKASCIFTPCDTNYHYYVAKSKYASVTLATTRTSSTRFKASACVTP